MICLKILTPNPRESKYRSQIRHCEESQRRSNLIKTLAIFFCVGFLLFFITLTATPVFAACIPGTSINLDSGTYSATVGSTFSVTVTSDFASQCIIAIKDNTSGSYTTVPTTDTDLDCNGATCTSSTHPFSKDIKCEATGIYNIRGEYGSASIVSSVSTVTCNASDIINPTVSTLSPADNATTVAVDNNLVITFSEAVDAETGNIDLYKTTSDVLIQSFDVTTDITGTGTDTITINPIADLSYETEYYVQIDATAFDDASSNSFAGIADTATWSFTTEDNPICPTLANTATYNAYPTCGASTCNNGYTLSNLVCTIIGGGPFFNVSFNPITEVVELEKPEVPEAPKVPEVVVKSAQEEKDELIAQIKKQLISLITQLIQLLTAKVEEMR